MGDKLDRTSSSLPAKCVTLVSVFTVVYSCCNFNHGQTALCSKAPSVSPGSLCLGALDRPSKQDCGFHSGSNIAHSMFIERVWLL